MPTLTTREQIRGAERRACTEAGGCPSHGTHGAYTEAVQRMVCLSRLIISLSHLHESEDYTETRQSGDLLNGTIQISYDKSEFALLVQMH